jgi:hypothetical protein
VLALEGTLGVGKTTLARELLRALGHEGEVPSPSFTIIETYDPPGVRLPVVHADFYRLEDPARPRRSGWTTIARVPCCWPNGPIMRVVSGMSAIASRCGWKSRKTGGRPLSCPARDG